MQCTCKIAAFCVLLFISLYFGQVTADFKCDCKLAKCKKISNCRWGTHKDMCNCCSVCAKGEGELCGGKHNAQGECGNKLQCMVRHIQSNRNRHKKSVSELIGRCEYIPCHYKSCPFGQMCTMVRSIPTCTCPKCKDMVMTPVCGEKNGKTYSNECKLREEECLGRKRIGMIKGKCEAKHSSHVYCREDKIRIELLKTFVGNANKRKITLQDRGCEFKSNETHYYIETNLDKCGTKSSFALTSIIYSNMIMSESDPNAIIIRSKDLIQIPVECFYSVRAKGSNKVKIEGKGDLGNRIEEHLRGNGIGVRIREERSQSPPVENEEVRVDIDHDSKYFVQLKAKSIVSKSTVHLYPKFCYATPVQRNLRWMKYTLVEDGCPTEESVEIMESQSPIIKLMIPGIHFDNTKYPGVLVRCKIRACFPKDPNNIQMCLPKCNKKNNKDVTNELGSNQISKQPNRKRRDISKSATAEVIYDYAIEELIFKNNHL